MAKSPNFFLVGAPKCGTTALFQYLSMHPQVFAPNIKEPNYFAADFPGLQFCNDIDSYLELFADATDEHLALGEASVCYLYSANAIANIFEFDPDAKIIVMVRNPSELVYALHSQSLYTLNEDIEDFETAWRLQAQRLAGKSVPNGCLEPAFLQYREIGLLSKHIRRFYDVFPQDQIKLIFFDDLQRDPRQVYEETVNFLGLSAFLIDEFPVVNPNKTLINKGLARRLSSRPGSALKFLAGCLKALPGMRNIPLRARISEYNEKQRKRPELSSQMKRELADSFRTDIQDLAQLSGRNLDVWLNV